MKSGYKFKCKVCENPMIKWGKTRAGKQRYKCNVCNKSNTKQKRNQRAKSRL